MIDWRKAIIDPEATLGSPKFLLRVAPTFAYANGIPTQQRDGTRYTIAGPNCDMSTIGVKIQGEQTLEMENNTIIPVEFEGLEMYPYLRDGKPQIGARAKAIRPLNDKR